MSVLLIAIAPACGGLNDDPHLPDSDTATDLLPESAEERQAVERDIDNETGMIEFSGEKIYFAYPDSLAGEAILEEYDGYPDDELAPKKPASPAEQQPPKPVFALHE